MSAQKRLEFPPWRKWWWRARIAIGRRINERVLPARELQLARDRDRVLHARSPGDSLTRYEMDKLASYMLDVQDRDIRREYFRTTPLERTFQGLVVPLVEQVVAADPSVAALANIGGNYAYIDSFLAARHPRVRFTCVDFSRNFAEYNAELARPNLDLRSGYAMQMLEAGELRADVFLFSSAAYEIKNAEVRRYFREFARAGARYVILNEPIYPMPGGAIVDPQSVPVDASVPVKSLAGFGAHRHGPLARVHNYRAMLEEAGFEMLHYHAFRPAFTDLRMVNVIAKRSGAPPA
jgi:hypothetical protein